jgi:hypothetical protein
MIRNDYRRALILLRSAVKGMSGHVRLERRTLGGSLRFSVSGAGTSDDLRALILRKGKGGWTAVPMGSLRVDNRGQAGMTWTFDPRNIDGYALEDYPVVAVVRMEKSGVVEPVLSGFLAGSTDVDWVQAMSSARAAYRRPAKPAEQPQQAEAQAESEPEPVGGLPEAEPEAGAEAQEPMQQGAPEAPAAEGMQAPTGEEGAEAVEGAPPDAGEVPAGLQMALDISIQWPEPIEPLRALFQQLPACQPFAADGYTFVCAPLPGNGRAHSLVGVRVEDERPVSVCYGIPGTFALEPPPGLDGYMWRGDGQNGWWVIFVDALTGEEIAG